MAAPTLTVNLSPTPFVEVFLGTGSVVAGTVTLRFYRVSDGRTWLVRGGVDRVPGSAVLDYEAPFGVPSSYYAEQFDASGASLGFTASAVVTVNVTDVWVHDPLAPWEAVNLGPNALLSVSSKNSRPVSGDVVQTEGATVPKWIGARRTAVAGMTIGLAVTSVGLMDQLQGMVGGYDDPTLGMLVIRTPPPVRMPRTLFAAVSDEDEQSVDVAWGGQRSNFVFTATEVQPPFPGLTVPLLRYADLDASFATYSAMDAAYATYSARDRDYSRAGTAP